MAASVKPPCSKNLLLQLFSAGELTARIGGVPVAAIPYAPLPPEQNPNINDRDHAEGVSVLDVYLRAAFVALAAFGRWNPGWRLVLLTNAEPPAPYREMLQSIGAEVVLHPFAHQPPVGFAPTFAGSLYLLDALSAFPGSDYVLLIDPDVLTVGEVSCLLAGDDRVATLPITVYGPDDEVNRLSRREAGALHGKLGEPRECPTHFGGEFYGIPASLAEAVRERASYAWNNSLQWFADGEKFFTTEEHLMGYVLADIPTRDSRDLVARIWTAHRRRTVTGSEGSLALWHLPSEKQRAFVTLFEAAQNRDGWFWNTSREEFVDRCGRISGFHHRTLKRLAMDAAGQFRRRVVQRKR
jgi:hypothetical protein